MTNRQRLCSTRVLSVLFSAVWPSPAGGATSSGTQTTERGPAYASKQLALVGPYLPQVQEK